MKVLIAEDDINILEGLQRLLEKEGYNTVAAANGAIAVDKYRDENPDFVILDIMMPELNGYDVCKEIRKSDATIPIIFLSAKSEEIDRVIGLELGADDFISKPFGTRELMARVRAVSRRALAQKPQNDSFEESFTMGNLTVRCSELRAERGDLVVDIGPRDVEILRLLKENRGKVVTRNMLFDRCWGEDFFGSTRTVDQHISQLRKKIETNPKEPQIIITVHGSGYRFEG